MSFIHRSGPGPRVFAAFAAAVLLLTVLAGAAAASESVGALRDPFVGPRVGTPGTVVRFSVTFSSSDGSSTPHVKVLIDGVARAMAPTPGGSIAFAIRYRLSTTLPVGRHVVVFFGADGSTSDVLAAGVVRIQAASGGNPGAHPAGSAPPTSRPTAATGGDTPTGGKPGGDAGGTSAPAKAPAATPAPGAPGGSHDGAGSFPDSATGGTQATHDDASGSADHPTSGPGGGPASGGSPAGAPPTAGADTGSGGANGVPSATPTPDGLALGVAGGPDGGSGGSGPRLDDRGLSLLTGNGHDIPPATRMLIAAISTTTTTTAAVAFFLFGKRRRDGEPPAPDEVLAANAGRFSSSAASALVPIGMPAGAGLLDEADIPRWRRPSLIQARKTDPRYSAVVAHDRLSFDHGAGSAAAGAERRVIRYRAVSLLDAPDPLRSSEIGDLDVGDEVQLLERSGGYWLVLCPDGSRGWVHRMTLGDVVTDQGDDDGAEAPRRSSATRMGESEDGEGAGEAAKSREVDRSIGEDGTDFLVDYLRRARRA